MDPNNPEPQKRQLNGWRYLVDHLAGMKKGEQYYRTSIDALKVVPPLPVPFVAQHLEGKGLPVNATGALHALTNAAVGAQTTPTEVVYGLAQYLKGHLPEEK